MTSSANRWGFVVVLAAALVGCGDDASGTDAGGGGDSGPRDGGPAMDAGPRDSGRRDAGRRDSGPSTMDECDPWMPGSCPEGEKCSVVIEVLPKPEMNILFFGCVPRGTPRTEGQFCGLFGNHLDDPSGRDLRTDVCEEGLFCWNEPGGGPLDTCQRLCGGETSPGCPAANFCQNLSDVPAFGVCEEADNCDPVYQTGCTGDEGCYLITDTAGDIVTSCFPFVPDAMMMPPPAGEPGEACPYINGCRPGAQCFGDMLPGGVTGTPTCYEICAAGAGGGGGDPGPVDAGSVDSGPPPGMDAGPPPVDAGPADAGRPPRTGMCMGTDMCVGLMPMMGTITSPTPPGICQ